jgi:TatA/E family protein of Tat protein translocase
MNTLLFVFEFLGTTELLVIAVVALILFGPRKLPEIGRKVGKGIAEFKRASDDFKRTWEFEVELEQRKPALDAAGGAQPGDMNAGADADGAAAGTPSEGFAGGDAQPGDAPQTVARGSSDPEGDAAGEGDVLFDRDEWGDAAAPDSAGTPAPRARGAEDEINAS